MNRFNFTLKEFWEKCMEPVYNADTGEQITSEKMLENKYREVLLFWAHFIDGIYGGISVKLENEDLSDEMLLQMVADICECEIDEVLEALKEGEE